MTNLLKILLVVALLSPFSTIALPLTSLERLNKDVYGVEMTIEEYIKQVAIDHGLNVERFLYTAKCESGFNPKIQSQHTYSNERYGPVGSQEQSYGLWQIHLPAHPDISKEQALDPIWSTDWAADEWVAGRQSQWSCYKDAYM